MKSTRQTASTSTAQEQVSTPAVQRPARSKSPKKATATITADPALTTDPRSAAEPTPANDSEVRNHMIARAAYFRAERRGFIEGSELQDWLEAESEIDSMIATSTAAVF